MGLLGLFGKGPLSERKISKIANLAANPFAQPDVRMRELNKLMNDGSPAAIRGALKRFAANAQGHIADEDEKKWLEDALVDEGDGAVEPLRSYIKEEKALTYALRAYRRISGDDETVRFLLDVLVAFGPEDYRSTEAKLQIVHQLAELVEDARVVPALVPFLHDHSDDVRWAVLDVLEQRADAGKLSPDLVGAACIELGKLVTDDDVGPRIARRAAEALCNREWSASTDAEDVASVLQDTFFLDKKKFVRKRAKPTARA
jgi:hypothetical protein